MLEHEIVIVGAGPTGLMLAGELALAGTDVAIVEERVTNNRNHARAGGLHIRSLELLDQRGIVDRFLAEGQTHPNVSFKIPLDITDSPSRHNYLLAIPQARSERLLTQWVDELKVPIYRGMEVVEIAQDDRGVYLSTARQERFRCAWLVGCDGGRSRVRKSVDIKFPGWDASTSWLMAEVKMTQPPELGFREDALGRHAMALREDGETVGIVLAGQPAEARGTPSMNELASSLIAVYGTDFGVHDPSWMSRFNDATRQADAYRKGRILLAGDAAHIHPPMGGQGLNLGIQDAANLGWKLAQVSNGISPVSLLDTYEEERHPVAERVLRNTIAQGVLRMPNDRVAVLGEFVAEMLSMDGPRRRFGAMISGLDICYGLGNQHPLLGCRMPDLDIFIGDETLRVFSLLHRARPVLLNLGKPESLAIGKWSTRVQVVDGQFEGAWELPIIGAVPPPTAVLIRPDGYVAWVGTGGSEGLVDALSTWFGH